MALGGGDTMRYDKLVREKVPEAIKQAGKIAVVERVPDSEMSLRLKLKLVEECSELIQANGTEIKDEVVDILEVLHAITKREGIPWNDIVRHCQDKYDAVGGFNQGLVLKEVTEG